MTSLSFRYLLRLIAVVASLVCTNLAQTQESTHDAPPRPRVVSMAPNITEMIYTLGCEDALVGVTDFCKFPPEAAKKPKIGGFHNTSLERLIAMRPDIVFYMAEDQKLTEQLAARGISTIRIPSETVADIRQGLRTIAKELGTMERAEALISVMDERLAELAARTCKANRPTVLWVVGHSPGELTNIYVAGPDTFLDEMLFHAGGINVMKDAETRYPTVSREFLIANPPEIVIDTRPAGGEWTENEEKKTREMWLEYLGPLAREKTMIVFLDDPHMTIPGPGVADNAWKLYKMLHDE